MDVRRQETGIAVRLMQALDIPSILEIETGAYQYPWSNGVFMDCLRAGYCCWVIEEHRRVKGYGIMQVIADEAHVLNLCIDPCRQRMGLGRRLLRQLMQIAVGHFAQNMLLEVRPSNKVAIGLYYSEGFSQVGRRSRYYPSHKGPNSREGGGNREDALVLTCPLDSNYEALFPQGLA